MRALRDRSVFRPHLQHLAEPQPASVQRDTYSGYSIQTHWISLALGLVWLVLAGAFCMMRPTPVAPPSPASQPILAATSAPRLLPQDNADYQALDQGLGIGLALLGDYMEPLNATSGLTDDWRLTQLDADDSRLECPGLSLYIKQWKIWQWSIDLDYAFTHDDAAWIRDRLTPTGLTPNLTWAAVTGTTWTGDKSREHLHVRQQYVTAKDGGGYPAYVLVFKAGRLCRIEGRLASSPTYYNLPATPESP